jgi:polysaccharide pyruvyl transferase WcaK-like protein
VKILVDHGSSHNLGDTAMIEGVVARLGFLLPDAQLFVVDNHLLRTDIWELPRVFRQNTYPLKPLRPSFLANLRFFWRWDDFRLRMTSRRLLARVGKQLTAGSVGLSQVGGVGNQPRTLGEFCQPFDALHVVGGGNLTETFFKQLFARCCLILTFSEQRKPVILTGQQIGPISSDLSKTGLARTLRKASFVGLREPTDSWEFCRDADLEPSRFEVMGDDSLGLPPADESAICGLLAQHGLHGTDFLAVNARVASYAAKHREYLQGIAAVIQRVACEFRMPVVVVPIALNPWDSDVAWGKELANAVHAADAIVLKDEGLTPGLVKRLLGKAFGAIGVSYHFCTFALSQGVPAVCLYAGGYYAQKGRGLCAFWQDDRLALPVGSVAPAAAAGHIGQVLRDTVLREKLRLRSVQAVNRWQEVFDREVNHFFRPAR